jgi:tRNA threonylcarbamoyladenosine biosynthesis protein TsaE
VATFISHNVEETKAFARVWAGTLLPNDVVALCGELGAGKTHFVQGLVAGCGSASAATSPTFTLLHEYRDGRLPIFHFDFYRIEQRSEIERLGFEEYLEEDGVSVIEWADRFPELLPQRTRWLKFVKLGEHERTISEENK